MEAHLKVARKNAERWLSKHVIEPRQSQSWTLFSRRPDGRYNSSYAYSVTWTPGSVVLAGDLGEMTLTHYHAFGTLENTVKLIHRADFDYLMSKSTEKEVFTAEGTYKFILELIGGDALDTLKDIRDRLRGNRADLAAGLDDYEKAVEVWQASGDGVEDRPDEFSFVPEDETETIKEALTFRPSSARRPLDIGWRAPEGFEGWLHLWNHFKSSYKMREAPDTPQVIMQSKWRRKLKEILLLELQNNGAASAADLCCALDLSDYYGSTAYTESSMYKTVAVKRWAAEIWDQFECRRETSGLDMMFAAVAAQGYGMPPLALFH